MTTAVINRWLHENLYVVGGAEREGRGGGWGREGGELSLWFRVVKKIGEGKRGFFLVGWG